MFKPDIEKIKRKSSFDTEANKQKLKKKPISNKRKQKYAIRQKLY